MNCDTLAAVTGAWALCFLFSPELFIQSICVTLSLCNVTTEMGERCSLLAPPRTVSLHADSRCLSCLSSLTYPVISLSSGTHAFLLGGWVKPVSSQLRDDRQSQLHSKMRPIDLFQELHSNPECVRNLYCRLNFALQPPKYKCPLYIGWNPTAQAESQLPRHYDYLVGISEPRNSEEKKKKTKLNNC